MSSDSPLTARAELLIRKPASAVFAAFVDPTITTKFWFTKSTGPLVPGARVRWDWEMFGVGDDVIVRAVEPHRRIAIDWGSDGQTTHVEWSFEERPNGTLVKIVHTGFQGTPDERVAQALDATGGFTLVLANLKALLEHDIDLNLIRDRFPDGVK